MPPTLKRSFSLWEWESSDESEKNEIEEILTSFREKCPNRFVQPISEGNDFPALLNSDHRNKKEVPETDDRITAYFKSQHNFYLRRTLESTVDALHLLKMQTSKIICEKDKEIDHLKSLISANNCLDFNIIQFDIEKELTSDTCSIFENDSIKSSTLESQNNFLDGRMSHRQIVEALQLDNTPKLVCSGPNNSVSSTPYGCKTKVEALHSSDVLVCDPFTEDLSRCNAYAHKSEFNSHKFSNQHECSQNFHTMSSKLKHPLRALVDQSTLVSRDKHPATMGLRGRRGSHQNLYHQSAIGSEVTGGGESVSSNTMARINSIRKDFFSFRTTLPARRMLQSTFSLGIGSGSDGQRQVSLGPYLRFAWIVSLGVLDSVLVLVILFWPGQDFICRFAPGVDGTVGVVREDDIIGVIAAILCLHLGDICLILTVTTARLVGLRLFSPEAAGGRGKALFNGMDCALILGSVAVVCANSDLCSRNLAEDTDSWLYRSVKKLHIIIHIVRCMMGIRKCTRLGKDLKIRLQRAVSTNKRRFVDAEGKFDLDLTYVCDRLIVMAIPCVDSAMYRNDIREVARFFATRHYGRFLVFNLCEDFETNGNGCYDCGLFFNQVQKLPFHDHNAPPLLVLVEFCKQATTWLNENPANVVAVHCQGGKGRSGTFCSALMLWTRFSSTASGAMKVFSGRRADSSKGSDRHQGVSSPSQMRYINYLEAIVCGDADFVSPVRVLITSVKLHTMPLYQRRSVRVCFIIESMGAVQYDHGKRQGLAELSCDPQTGEEEFRFDMDDVLVAGDVTVRFYVFDCLNIGSSLHCEVGPGARTIRYGGAVGRQLLFVTFHTSFDNGNLVFPRAEVDGAYDRSSREFRDDFAVAITCQRSSTPSRLRTRGVSAQAPPRPTNRLGEDDGCAGEGRGLTSLPYGSAAGPRLMRLCEVLEDVMRGIGTEGLRFTRGQVIYDPCADEAERSLYIIAAGTAEFFQRDDNTRQARREGSRINRGDSIAGMPLGRGHVFGVVKFLLGGDADQSSFCIRATSAVMEVRAFRFSGETEGLVGIIPAMCILHSASKMAVLFEVLAKLVSVKAQELAAHIGRHSINPSNVKRDANAGARDAHQIRKIVEELNLADTVTKTAKATLALRSGGTVGGLLIVFPHKLLFYSTDQERFQRRHLRIFFKDIVGVMEPPRSGKLSVFVAGDLLGGLEAIERTPTSEVLPAPQGFVGTMAPAANVDMEDGQCSGEALGVVKGHRPDEAGIDVLGSAFGACGGQGGAGPTLRPVPIMKNHFRNIADVAVAARDPSDGQMKLQVQISMADERVCEEVWEIILERTHEIQEASLSHQMETRYTGDRPLGAGGPRQMLFGYVMPGEAAGKEELEAVNQIFMQAKTYTYMAGEVIVHRGNLDRNLFHVLRGTALRMFANGQVMFRMGPGEIFGETGFVDTGDTGASSDVVAEGAVECLVLSRETMEMMTALHPEAGARFWRRLAVAAAFRIRQQHSAMEYRRLAAERTCALQG